MPYILPGTIPGSRSCLMRTDYDIRIVSSFYSLYYNHGGRKLSSSVDPGSGPSLSGDKLLASTPLYKHLPYLPSSLTLSTHSNQEGFLAGGNHGFISLKERTHINKKSMPSGSELLDQLLRVRDSFKENRQACQSLRENRSPRCSHIL